jgi:hypothetical protein
MDGLPKLVQLVILMADVDDTWPERLELKMTYSTLLVWFRMLLCSTGQTVYQTKYFKVVKSVLQAPFTVRMKDIVNLCK